MRDLALVGLGRIARAAHLPALADSAGFRLAATADPAGALPDVPAFADLDALLGAMPGVRAAMICTPPQLRFAIARRALLAGCDVALEKPPGSTLGEVETLARIAAAEGRVLFATWHSQFAAGVEPARVWLAGREVTGLRVTWREDVRRWHPGQDWIFAAGGMGVFDPGINALSILTRILPVALHVTAAELDVPAGRDAPVAARLTMATEAGAPAALDFDFRGAGQPRWEMRIDTDAGPLELSDGGATVRAAGAVLAGAASPAGEYPRIYARFAELIAARRSDVDLAPLRHVADAMMLGRRRNVEAFQW